MRRDSFRLEVANVAWHEAGDAPRQPTLAVHAEGGGERLRDRLTRGDETPVAAGDVDVTYRLQPSGDDEPARGVLAIANRVTGAFLVEVSADGADISSFVAAARRYAERTDDASRYRVRVLDDGEVLFDVDKRTLLVYSADGELLRQHSLIPSGVEI